MDDIAKAVGASKKTLYQYFKDKEALINAVLDHVLERDNNQLELICARSQSAIHEAILITEHVRALLRRIHSSVLYDLQKFYREAWHRFIHQKEKTIEACIERNMLRGIQDGTYRSDLHIPIITRMRIQMIQLSLNQEVFPSEVYHPETVQNVLIDLVTRGMLSEKGRLIWENYKQSESLKENSQKITYQQSNETL